MNVKIKILKNECNYNTLTPQECFDNSQYHGNKKISIGRETAILDSKEEDMRNILQQSHKNMEKEFIKVREKQKQNKFLTGVVEDYIKYYKYIKKQKEDQEKALRVISDYIDGISQDTEISKSLLEQSKEDQKDILAKMKQIKHEVDKITKMVG